MKTTFAALLGTAIALTSTFALAAEPGGFRVEARAGYGSTQYENEHTSLEGKETGASWGVGVGYDFGIGGQYYLGADLGLDQSSAAFQEKGGTISLEAELGRELEAGGRFGRAFENGMNLYARAAYVTATIDGEITFGGTGGSTRSPFTADTNGYRLAAGLELPMSERAFAKGEFRHTQYDEGLSSNQFVLGLGWRF